MDDKSKSILTYIDCIPILSRLYVFVFCKKENFRQIATSYRAFDRKFHADAVTSLCTNIWCNDKAHHNNNLKETNSQIQMKWIINDIQANCIQ